MQNNDKLVLSIVTLVIVFILGTTLFRLFTVYRMSPHFSRRITHAAAWASKEERAKHWVCVQLDYVPDIEQWQQESQYWKRQYNKYLKLNPTPKMLSTNNLIRENADITTEYEHHTQMLELCTELDRLQRLWQDAPTHEALLKQIEKLREHIDYLQQRIKFFADILDKGPELELKAEDLTSEIAQLAEKLYTTKQQEEN